MPDYLASSQSGTGKKKLPMPETIRDRKETQSSTGMLCYRTEMTDAGSISLDADAQR
jgi:hypothetical protein